jgi:hypothetical protein
VTSIANEHTPPNNALEPTPLCGEQDRANFETRFCPDYFPDLWVRRGSMLAVRPPINAIAYVYFVTVARKPLSVYFCIVEQTTNPPNEC